MRWMAVLKRFCMDDKIRMKTGYLMDGIAFVVSALLFLSVAGCVFTNYAGKETVYTHENGVFQSVDFISYYAIGNILKSKKSHELYDPAVQMEFFNDAIKPLKLEVSVYNQYPPFYYLLFVPFTVLPIRTAFFSWLALTSLTGGLALILLSTRGSGLSKMGAAFVALSTLASFPGFNVFTFGLASWLFLAFFCLFYWSLISNNQLRSGINLGLLAMKPHYMVSALVPALFVKSKTIFLSLLATVILLCLSAGIVAGFENVLGYSKAIVIADSSNLTSNLYPERMICLRQILTFFLARDQALLLSLVVFFLSLIASGWLFHQSIVEKKFPLPWAISLSILLLLLFSPHQHVNDCILIAICTVLTVPSIRPSILFGIKPWSLRIWCGLLLIYPVLSWLFMVFAPMLCPEWLKSASEVNGLPGGLTGFTSYFVLHLILLFLGLSYLRALETEAAASEKD